MATTLEDLRVLRAAEEIADDIWKLTAGWDAFARDVVGKQIARAADSIGANIAESYGRFHYGEKLQFLYYARGSLFETKYWLNRAASRQLLSTRLAQANAERLSALAHQLNLFAAAIKRQRAEGHQPPSKLREPSTAYTLPSEHPTNNLPDELPLFTTTDLTFIATLQLLEGA